jgi:hypothetical protein
LNCKITVVSKGARNLSEWNLSESLFSTKPKSFRMASFRMASFRKESFRMESIRRNLSENTCKTQLEYFRMEYFRRNLSENIFREFRESLPSGKTLKVFKENSLKFGTIRIAA